MKSSHARAFLAVVAVVAIAIVHHVFAAPPSVVPLGTGTPALTPADLVTTFVGPGITNISNVAFIGSAKAAGTFAGVADSIGLDSGIVLSTGEIATNVIGQAGSNPGGSTTLGKPGDAALTTLGGQPTFDATVLEFDFMPDKAKVFFQYVFASAEYNEFVGFGSNDVFSFEVTDAAHRKVNCAMIGGEPISINTINGGTLVDPVPPSQLFTLNSLQASHPELFINNDPQTAGSANRNTPMDGLTRVLTCQADVTPRATNHIRLAIADAFDAFYDSNVLLRAASFTTTPPLSIVKKTNGTDNDLEPGVLIAAGQPVRWTYDVKNSSPDTLSNVRVTDDHGVVVTCPLPTLLSGQSETCTAADGIAVQGAYSNIGTATATSPVAGPISDQNADHYFGAKPSITIVTKTNETDNNVAPGPAIRSGTPVLWTYEVANTGNVALNGVAVTDSQGIPVSCALVPGGPPKTTLAPGETMVCSASGTAASGQHSNTGTATGSIQVFTVTGNPDTVTVTSSDVDNYFGADPKLSAVTKTDGTDNDAAPGPSILKGDPLTWTYEVTNSGNVALSGVTVTDDQIGAVCSIGALTIGETKSCTKDGTALKGQHTNTGSASGTYGPVRVDGTAATTAVTVTASNIDHYFGAAPELAIVKKTGADGVSGTDNDTEPGPVILVGDPVAWTYAVTNTGNVPLANVAVTDDKVGAICTVASLAAGETTTCAKGGIAQPNQYTNTGTATASAEVVVSSGLTKTVPVTASNVDHYYGADPRISIVTKTNGTDNDVAPGPSIHVGDPVKWTYDVRNTGNVPLTDVTVTDDQAGAICAIGPLTVGAMASCTKTAQAQSGQYQNVGKATGNASVVTVTGTKLATATATNADHYFGADPKVSIVTKTDGNDNDGTSGPAVLVGDELQWTYLVTNTGNVPLSDLAVTDDKLGSVCPIASLAVGATTTCSKSANATKGQYTNTGSVNGTYDHVLVNGTSETGSVLVTASNVDHYFGVNPEVSIVKRTGADATSATDNDAAPGPSILVGDPLAWAFDVTNTGNVPLRDVTVNDDKIGFICTIGPLAVGASTTCTKSGIAAKGQHENIGTASGQADVVTVNGAKTVTVKANNIDHYYGVDPNIAIVKKTGPAAASATDNPVAPGPVFQVGDPVAWTYTVTNTGNVALTDVSVVDDKVSVGPDCTIGTLAAGESRTCYATGFAQKDQHENIGTASGKADVVTVTGLRSVIKTAKDVDHYFGADPRIAIVKKTDGTDNDLAPGPFVLVDSVETWTRWNGPFREPLTCSHKDEHFKHPMTWSASHRKEHESEPQNWTYKKEHTKEQVTWTYEVKNTGNVPLKDVAVTDDKVGSICTIGSLAVGATASCTSSGGAVTGQYENTGIATGKADIVTVNGARSVTVTDRNVDHYFGADPNVTIVKLTNGTDNNGPKGPTLLVGTPVTWTYIVTNTGNAPLTDLRVTDDKAGAICTIPSLAAGARAFCTKTSTVVKGWYKNVGTVTARLDTLTSNGQVKTVTVSDTDVDQYFGAQPGIAIVKKTNDTNNNWAPGPSIQVGQAVTWTYTVTNIGNVPLTHVVIIDSKGVAVSCSGSAASQSYGKSYDKDDDNDRWKGDSDSHHSSSELAAGASMTCSANGKAVEGQYSNVGTVTATAPVGPPVTASDIDFYYGVKAHKAQGGKDRDGQDEDDKEYRNDDRDVKGKDKLYDKD